MSPAIASVASQVAEPLTELLGVLAVAALGAATRALIKHTASARGKALIERLDVAAEAAVRQVAQTETDALKAARGPDGALTPEEAKAASARALAIVKANLGKNALAEIKSVVGADDIEALITTHNEAAVHKIAGEPPPAAPPVAAPQR